MPQGKVYETCQAAIADVTDGSVILVSGFAGMGTPGYLIRALVERQVKDLTCVFTYSRADTVMTPGGNIAARQPCSVQDLVEGEQVRKIISPFPFDPELNSLLAEACDNEALEIEPISQGLLAEKLRAAGAGIGGIFLPLEARGGFGVMRDPRSFSGEPAYLETPLKGDFALIRAATADTLGNLVYEGTGRNWGPVMAPAARVTVAEVDRILEPGELDPEAVITPGIFVNRIVKSTPPRGRLSRQG